MEANYRIPKGCVDLYDTDYDKFNIITDFLEELFIKNGGIPLETPVFENKEILTSESDTSKLTFDLVNYGSEDQDKFTLRYDHTVPLKRFILSNGIKKCKRYTIGKVYRRDQPSLGRYREFYQGDFDIIGESNDHMINEFNIIFMAIQFLNKYNITNYEILVNHTDNLKSIYKKTFNIDEISFDKKKFNSICQIIDKLDKVKFNDLISEFLSKGCTLDEVSTLHDIFESNKIINNDVLINMDKLYSYCNIYGFEDKIIFKNSLARGLDYYNGFIFEIKLKNFNNLTVISGGRYDNFINDLTSIGISFGISRLFNVINLKLDDFKDLYYICTIENPFDSSNILENKLLIKKKLEDKLGINIMISDNNVDKKLVKVITECINKKIRYLFIIAKNEYQNNKIILKDLKLKTSSEIDIN